METIRYRVARIQGDYAVLVPEADFDQLVEVFVIKSFDIQT